MHSRLSRPRKCRGRLGGWRLDEQHGIQIVPHHLLRLASPNEPSDPATTVTAHHDQDSFAQFPYLFFELMPGLGLIPHYDGLLKRHFGRVCLERALLHLEIDWFRIMRVEENSPVLGDD